MDLQQLSTFRVIATVGSFSQAADIMGYAQSTVSEQIKNLESDLHTRLFKRSGSKRVSLTPAGEMLLKYAQKMSNLEDEIKAEIISPEEPHGTFSIRIPETISTYYLPHTIDRFHSQFPGVNLNFMDCTFFDLPDDLGAGVVDLGFVICDTYQTTNQTSEFICRIPLALVTGEIGEFQKNELFDLTRMSGKPLIAPSNDCSYLHMIDRLLTEQKIKFPGVWRFNSIEAIKQTLAHGTGFAVLPEVAVNREVEQRKLMLLPWKDDVLMSANLWMVWQTSKWLPPALRVLMDMIREDLRMQETVIHN
ncbi:MAG: LysR family transcriptional regulator [Leptolinea sp.]|jgi:DNA-binding transcriptional LysR family regulator|nr:LysR family transcriptional regulator [Leptolinea sp.]